VANLSTEITHQINHNRRCAIHCILGAVSGSIFEVLHRCVIKRNQGYASSFCMITSTITFQHTPYDGQRNVKQHKHEINQNLGSDIFHDFRPQSLANTICTTKKLENGSCIRVSVPCYTLLIVLLQEQPYTLWHFLIHPKF
jgi:hypothetical protein